MRFTIAVVLALLALLHPIPCFTQETTGNLEGQIVDEAGQIVPLAGITVTGPNLQGSREHVAAPDGYFGIFNLPVGVYTVKISHISYHEVTYENVVVRLGRTTTLGEVRLTSKAFEIPEVVVREQRPLIDPTSTAIGATLTMNEFGELPIDRNYKDIPALLPHANESFLGDEVNLAGATGQENKYFIDGAETTDPYLGLTGTNLPYNFVKDVQVRAGGYEAEYRSSLGGIVNVVSRSGGNEFRGQAFGFFVNNQFAGTTRHGVAEPKTGDFAQYDVGIGLGGPIIHDKLWFFAAYNPAFSTEDVDIPGTGFHQDKNVTHIFAAKLDWKAASRTNIAFTVTGDPSQRDGIGVTFGGVGRADSFANPDPFLVDVTTGGVNLLAKGTHMFSDKLFIEASVSEITRRIKYEGATERGRNEPLFIDEATGIWSGGYPTPTNDYSVQITGDVKGTFMLDRHMLKAGLAYRDNRLDFNEEWIVLHQFSDTLYREVSFTAIDGTVRNRIPSVFVQDSWRITERVRVNAGLRWDGQYLVGSDGDIAQKITDQYQPRIGFVYQPGELGSQKVFGSFGRFYQDPSMALAVNKLNERMLLRITEWDHDPRIDPSGGVVSYESFGTILPEVEDLKGQHFDEFTLGYERQLGNHFAIGARGVYRTLREGIEDGFSESVGDFVYGNPGRGALSNFPKMTREYRALELTAQALGGVRYNARVSYVLSRTYGNYPGLFTPTGWILPNTGALFDLPENVVDSEGKLPNDRPHIFKLSGFYQVGFGLTAGASFTWMSGTPLSVYEGSSWGWPFVNFAQQRGTAGRTPSLWDLNLRFVYDLSHVMETALQPRLILDVFHLGSQREPVWIDELKNFNQDDTGNQIDPNPTFGLPFRYQPPTAVRLGFEVDF